MKCISKILFLLFLSKSVSQTNPDVKSLTYGEFIEKREVIAETSHNGQVWSLVSITDEYTGALFVFRTKDGNSEVVGGDSSPFPLSRYSIPTPVIAKLADLYVQYEIKNTPGGLAELKKRVATYNKIPHDLKDAYSKYMEVEALPTYILENQDLEQMIQVLQQVIATSDSEKLRILEIQKLNPLLPFLNVKMASDSSEELVAVVFEAVSIHPKNKVLQEVIAVFAGRQPELFHTYWKDANSAKKISVIQALKGAIENRRIGGVVKATVQDLISQLSD